jgi:long-chain acyl-CoA synthetase
MRREHLLDFFEDFASSDETFVVHDDGYRVRQITYRQLAGDARAFSARLEREGIHAGEMVVFWSENRIEWLTAFWGCLLRGATVVPVDFRASEDLLRRIVDVVKAKVVLVGDEVRRPSIEGAKIWAMQGLGGTSEPGTPEPQNPGTSEPQNLRTREPRKGSDLAEIIFTSGATAEPKGVTITHRNVLANVIPIEREISKYRKYAKPFQPLRFLNLLPLSHMFGQSMATFVPPMLRGTVVFSHGYSPTEILHQIKSRRVSVLVCVPKVLDVLREHVQRVAPDVMEPDALAGKHFLWRWWRYRHVHRLFGWKFWCIVCGAAPLEPELEAFWRKLGFLVVQGYGLTETAPVVTLNHPFRASKGTVGTPIGGVQVKIAPDGEILVRGDNVTTGYYRPAGAIDAGAEPAGQPDSPFKDGWFHTGDIGELDKDGRLLIKGRKKEMIVTPQGLNVFPEDVERALTAQPGVKDAGVVGKRVAGEERVHAVLLLDEGTDVDAVVRAANATLEDHQRVWSTSIWPERTLPRTEGTQKLKRRELQRWVAGEASPAAPIGGSSVEAIVSRFAAGRELKPDTTLDELGLSSLVRVELSMALEEAFQITIDESALAEAKSIGDLKRLVEDQALGTRHSAPGSPVTESDLVPSAKSLAPDSLVFPRWNRWPLSWFLRRISLPTWILPLGRPFVQLRVDGLEHLKDLRGPVIFAANHQSHFDVPTIMMALPARWRYWIAPAMSREFFYAHFHRRQVSFKSWLTNSANYFGSSMFFNAFPLAQSGAGTRQTLRYVGDVAAGGYSILIFPEGVRHNEGEMAPFRPGVGMIAARLDLPVVPVRLEGLDKVLHKTMRWPKRGPARVAFGAPLRLTGEDYGALAKQVEEAVKGL